MELWASGYKYEESANKVAEMLVLKGRGIKVTVKSSKKGKYPYPAWDVLVEGTRADAYIKLSGKDAEEELPSVASPFPKPEDVKAEAKPELKGMPDESWRLQDIYHWAKEHKLDVSWPISKDALLDLISKIKP